ncbi:hypothetical protein CRUP_031422, partial [Coryphaenoides rupestris]
EQVRSPGSSVTFWTPEMRGGGGGLRHVLWQHGADRLLWVSEACRPEEFRRKKTPQPNGMWCSMSR